MREKEPTPSLSLPLPSVFCSPLPVPVNDLECWPYLQWWPVLSFDHSLEEALGTLQLITIGKRLTRKLQAPAFTHKEGRSRQKHALELRPCHRHT